MKVVFVFSDNFPGNSAYSNRFQSLAKGLIHAKDEVEVAVVFPGKKSTTSQSVFKRGESDGVPYRYYCMHKYKPTNRILRKIEGLIGILNFTLQLFFKFGANKPNFIILGSSNLLHLVLLFIVGKMKGIKILREKNELPRFALYNTSYLAKISRYRLLDGFIFMTSKLSDYFNEELNISKKSTIVNMTVDTDRFSNVSPYNSGEDYILLVGDITGDKDGVEILISAFEKVHQKYPVLKLYLIGDISNKEGLTKRKEQINRLSLGGYINFLGVVGRSDIPSLMKGSKLLLLSRPSSKQAEGGFPTKLGEYLSSGVPTIVTRTGEISLFLEDMVNSFLVQPGDSTAFADKITYALANYNLAKEVGLNGKAVVKNNFSYISQGKKLHVFLRSF